MNDIIASPYEKKNLWFCQACCRWLTRKERGEQNCVDLCSACYSSECRLLRNEHNDIKKNVIHVKDNSLIIFAITPILIIKYVVLLRNALIVMKYIMVILASINAGLFDVTSAMKLMFL